MQISTKFTIAIHILTATEYFSSENKITSDFLAGSTGTNPVIIRNIMAQLKDAGLIAVKRGPGGMTLARPLAKITFLDVYQAVETNSGEELFRFHERPHPDCPVGRNLHRSLDGALCDIQRSFEKEMAKHTVGEVYEKMTISREIV